MSISVRPEWATPAQWASALGAVLCERESGRVLITHQELEDIVDHRFALDRDDSSMGVWFSSRGKPARPRDARGLLGPAMDMGED